MTRAIVCGGRDYEDGHYVFDTLDFLRQTTGISHVIEGGQRTIDRRTGKPKGGADYWAMRWAKSRGITWDTVPADWDKHGRAAGPMRNGKMLGEFYPDVVISFPGGRGTQDMIARAERAGIPVSRIKPHL